MPDSALYYIISHHWKLSANMSLQVQHNCCFLPFAPLQPNELTGHMSTAHEQISADCVLPQPLRPCILASFLRGLSGPSEGCAGSLTWLWRWLHNHLRGMLEVWLLTFTSNQKELVSQIGIPSHMADFWEGLPALHTPTEIEIHYVALCTFESSCILIFIYFTHP